MFGKINFRYTDAEEEKLYAPELIKDAYVDINNILQSVEYPEKFIIIGPKGSGKTALSSKLVLKSESKTNLFVENDDLEQFEFKLLEKTGGQKGTSIGGAITVWQMILFLRLIPIMLKDESLCKKNGDLVKFYKKLKEYGLAASSNLIKIIQYTSRRGIFGKIKSIISEVSGQKTDEEQFSIKDPAAIYDSIKHVLERTNPTDSKFYLILDGIDFPLRHGSSSAPYISDLINAVRQINIFLLKVKINAKILILIRDEILSIVPNPNLTKRINDNGIYLKWFDNSRDPLETELLKIIERRAKLAGEKGTIEQLWGKWFPVYIHNSTSYHFVLNNTRFLPRDIISFFREMQKISIKSPFKQNDVLAALNNYSDWFLQELKDALVGVISEETRGIITDLLFELGKSFEYVDFEKKLKELMPTHKEPVERIANELFNTSWIGNQWIDPRSKTPRYNWIHRKRTATFKKNKLIIVHPGLYKSLNLL